MQYVTIGLDPYNGKPVIFCADKSKAKSHTECKEKNVPHYGEYYHVNECVNCGHLFCYDSSG